jgi:hypothetical protein
MNTVAAIRERHASCDHEWGGGGCDAADLLAHLDALAAKVEALSVYSTSTGDYIDRDDVLDLLCGG